MFELFTIIIAVPFVILAIIIAGIVKAIRSRKQKKANATANTNRVTITITNSSNNGNSVKTTIIQDGEVKYEQSSEF